MGDFPPYEELVALVNKILDDAKGEKLTLRQIYYKLVVLKAFENTVNNYKTLSSRLVLAREKGDVDDRRIEDRARQVRGGDWSFRLPEDYYEDHETAFRDCWKDYSRPFWLDQPHYVEVFIEKDSLSSPVSSAANEYNVVTCVNRGYASYSYINEAVKRINRAIFIDSDNPRTPHILYLGDHDPSGNDMVRDLEARLRKYGLECPEDFQIVEKIGVTQSQIQELNLPTIPISKIKQKSDKRSKKFMDEFGKETVELDVFDNEQLKSLVKTAIEAYIDPEIWNKHQDASEIERDTLHKRIEQHFRG
jgi:hypothetical protein